MPEKKTISSETKMKSGPISVSVGTMDRKTPNSIYVDMNGYITPTKKQETYEGELRALENSITWKLNETIKNNDGAFEKNAISVFDVAGKRMSYGKKSYFSLQYFLKLKNGFMKDNESCFSNMLQTNEFKTITDDSVVSKMFKERGFEVCKRNQ